MEKLWINNSLNDRIFMLDKADETHYDLLSPDVINIIPPGNVIDDWRSDYENMQQSFIYGQSKSFDELINRILELQNRLQEIDGN